MHFGSEEQSASDSSRVLTMISLGVLVHIRVCLMVYLPISGAEIFYNKSIIFLENKNTSNIWQRPSDHSFHINLPAVDLIAFSVVGITGCTEINSYLNVCLIFHPVKYNVISFFIQSQREIVYLVIHNY